MIHGSLRNLLLNGPSSRKKHLDKFFKICHMGFWRLVRNSFQSQKTRVLHNEGYIQGIFQKPFIFPCISWLFIALSVSPSSKLTIFTHKTSIFSIISSPIFKKRYEFCLFLNTVYVSSPRFLGLCVFVEIWKYDVEYGLWIFCWDWCWVFLVVIV